MKQISNSDNSHPIAQLQNQTTTQGQIKRETGLIPNWKHRQYIIHYQPTVSLKITVIKPKDKQIDEVIDLVQSRLTKKCSIIEKHCCFGIVNQAQKKYLVSFKNEEETKTLFQLLLKARSFLRGDSSKKSSRMISEQGSAKQQESPVKIINGEQLQFQKHQYSQDDEPCKQVNQLNMSTKETTPVKLVQSQKQKQEQNEHSQEIFCTVLSQHPIQPPPNHNPLSLKQPVSSQQMRCIDSDDGFKLWLNFQDGRILVKDSAQIKTNVVVISHYSLIDMMQCFFHFQLWNQRIKQFKVITRMEAGMYLVYLQMHKCGLFTLPRYCYLIVSTYSTKQELTIVMRSMNQNHFDAPIGKQWIPIVSIAKFKQCVSSPTQKLLSWYLKADVNNFKCGLRLVEQIKAYQSFLRTISKMPLNVLEWRNQII